MNQEKSAKSNSRILYRLTICLAILLAGLAGMFILIKMKKPPTEAAVSKRLIRVETLKVKPENVESKITGFGQIQVLKKVSISAEVPGQIVFVHPRLKPGEIIDKDDILFKVDPSDFLTALDRSQAEVERAQNQIQLIKKQLKLDSRRFNLIQRNQEIARTDYERQRKLYHRQKIGSLSDVEKYERAYNSAADQAAQLAKAIELYPLQIKDAQYNYTAAKSRLITAAKNLARCDIKADFTGRLSKVAIETGQYISPGQVALILADDSILEIPVSIDSSKAKKWLRFKPETNNGRLHDVEPVECEIRWVEDNKKIWKGYLHRIIEFDPVTRTMSLAIRINNHQENISKDNHLPLIEGMFCSISIPGRIMKNVYRLPRWAVNYKNTTFLAINNRLKTVPVEIMEIMGEEAFISTGLKEGDQVIITRLVEPLEGSSLEIQTNAATPEAKP